MDDQRHLVTCPRCIAEIERRLAGPGMIGVDVSLVAPARGAELAVATHSATSLASAYALVVRATTAVFSDGPPRPRIRAGAEPDPKPHDRQH
jgi:hypothetical protein